MDVDGLRALEQAATPGPWEVDDFGSRIVLSAAEGETLVAEIDTSYDSPFDRGECEADAALIVAARNALPGLLARVAAAEAERDALLTALERVREVLKKIRMEHADLAPYPDADWRVFADWASNIALAVLAAPVPSGPAEEDT